MRLIDADYILSALGVFTSEEPESAHFMNGIKTAREIVEDAPTVGGWISVQDRLPERGNTCLVWLRGGGMTFMAFDGSRFIGGSAYSDDRITHWMLLPGAPEEVGT